MRRFSCPALLLLLGSGVLAQAAPQVRVHVGSTIVPGSRGVQDLPGGVDFGAAAVGTVAAKTFTVKNVGSDPLRLGMPIHLPPGFTLVRTFAQATLAPGATTTFVAALNSAKAGRLGGQIAFGTNERPGSVFRMTISGTALAPPSFRIIANGDPGFRTSGKWSPLAVSAKQMKASQSVPGRGAGVASWTFTGLQPGHYQVAATWNAQANLASRARFALWDGKKVLGTTTVDQTQTPADFRDAGTAWKNLGRPLFISGDSLVVKLSDQADATVRAGAVRLERVSFPGRILTGSDSAGGNRATWTFTGLVPGQYRVSTTWTAGSQSTIQYTILDGNRAVAGGQVDRRQAPQDLRDAGTQWNDLGGWGSLHRITGRSLVVLANGQGNFGPVRVERVYNPAGSVGIEGSGSYADTVRFLEQATWGPSDALINHVQNEVGFSGFLAEQFDPNQTPISSYPQQPPMPQNTNVGCPTGSDPNCARDNYTMYPMQLVFFTNAFYGPDQVRQRMAFALHKIFVVAGSDATLHQPSRMAPYLQIFDYNAFGNYRDVLGQVTLNAAMGDYLNMRTSTKTNPNENYGREVLQLFSIGLFQLNPDGTPVIGTDGNPVPTYDQTIVTAFARVFTGWHLAAPPGPGLLNYIDPMVSTQSQHDIDPKTLLNGVTLPANRQAARDLSDGLDNIFNHANVGPFISKNLIQQFVTSNPKPEYVARVAAVFNDNGQGTRGDLGAVVAAILLDPEARGDLKNDDPVYPYGKQREPVQYINNLLRAFPAISYDQTGLSDGYLNPQAINMGQDLFRPPSVFSYFAPDNLLPGTTDVLAPEFQILTTGTVLKRANVVNTLVNPNGNANGYGVNVGNSAPYGTKPDLTAAVNLAGDPAALVEYLNQLMLHGTMSNEMRTSVANAVGTIAANNPLRRAKAAVYLVATSSQYQVQR